jgi:uncharacterized protein YgiM (DUF1202 family)
MLIIAVIPATSLADSTKTVYVSRNGGNSRINLREGPGYDYDATGNVAKHNDKVTVIKTSGEWSKVKVSRSGKTGWIRTYYIDGTTKKLGTGTHVITGKTKVYKNYTTDSKVMGTLEKGDTVKVYYTDHDFAKVTVSGSTVRGWIPMRRIGEETDLKPEKPSFSSETVYRVKTKGSNLNVRTGPGTSFTAINSLANGTGVTILEKSGNWRRVKANNGVTGWVSANYLVKSASAVVTATVNTNTRGLNLRTRASLSAPVITSVKKGTKVTVNSVNGDWAYVTVNGKTGYMWRSWLKF